MNITENNKPTIRTLNNIAKLAFFVAAVAASNPAKATTAEIGVNGLNISFTAPSDNHSFRSLTRDQERAKAEESTLPVVTKTEDEKQVSALDQIAFMAKEFKSRATPRLGFNVTSESGDVLIAGKGKVELEKLNVGQPWKSEVAAQFNVVSPVISPNLTLQMRADEDGARAYAEYKVPFNKLFFRR